MTPVLPFLASSQHGLVEASLGSLCDVPTKDGLNRELHDVEATRGELPRSEPVGLTKIDPGVR